MREIKFRCWHRSATSVWNKKHTKVISYNAGMIYDDSPGDCLKWKNDGQDIDAIMQFTGLRDAKGIEIYEGDIVEIQNLPCQIQKARLNGVIEFSSWGAWEAKIRKVVAWTGYTHGVEPPESILLMNILSTRTIRIIGNIHENPELGR